jgi:hypothetical protein
LLDIFNLQSSRVEQCQLDSKDIDGQRNGKRGDSILTVGKERVFSVNPLEAVTVPLLQGYSLRGGIINVAGRGYGESGIFPQVRIAACIGIEADTRGDGGAGVAPPCLVGHSDTKTLNPETKPYPPDMPVSRLGTYSVLKNISVLPE